MALQTNNPIDGSKTDVIQTLDHFKRSRKAAAFASIFSLFGFLFSVYLVVPVFFTHFWLIIPLFFMLLFAKSYGAWDSYVHVRQNSEELEEQLAIIEQDILKQTDDLKNSSTNKDKDVK